MSELFSERYGYTKSSDCIIKGKITLKIVDALSSCFTQLKEDMDDVDYLESEAKGNDDWLYLSNKFFERMDRTVWTDFMDRRAEAA
jgi:hypothetical protein